MRNKCFSCNKVWLGQISRKPKLTQLQSLYGDLKGDERHGLSNHPMIKKIYIYIIGKKKEEEQIATCFKSVLRKCIHIFFYYNKLGLGNFIWSAKLPQHEMAVFILEIAGHKIYSLQPLLKLYI